MYRNVWIKYMNIKVTWGKELPARGLLSGERTKEESGNNLLKYFPFIKKKMAEGLSTSLFLRLTEQLMRYCQLQKIIVVSVET